jgi:methyl-accepting chemotaxis protein
MKAAIASRWNAYLWLPMMSGVVSAVLLLAAGGIGVASVVCAAIVLGVAAYAGRTLARAHAAALNACANAAGRASAKIIDVCAQTFPVWRRQVDTSRGEADNAIAELTRTFAAITEKLENVMKASSLAGSGAEDGRDNVMDAIANSGADLDGLVDALRQLQESKAGIVSQIGVQAESLRDNAAEVRGIAMQIRILTLNAAIEAARAGSAGAPFAVIVSDMRQLAMRTADTSEQISKQTALLNEAVEAAFKENTEGSASGTSIARAQEVIRGVVMSFHAMTESLSGEIDAMARERDEVRGDISNALVSLQFQDRVSQILSHVSRSMALMSDRMADGSLREGDVKAWLDEMSAAYTTNEEFTNLAREPSRERTPSKEITYF